MPTAPSSDVPRAADTVVADIVIPVYNEGLSGISYRFVEGRLSRALLPIYNGVYERLMRLPFLENRFGTFLIATATKSGQ